MAGVERCQFFIDECLSPSFIERFSMRGIGAIHPLNVGWRGQKDYAVLERCLREDRILVTENARDFRKLVGRAEMHPGLVVLPSIDREGSWTLMEAVLAYLDRQPDGRDYMFNRVLEVNENGEIRSYRLPRLKDDAC